MLAVSPLRHQKFGIGWFYEKAVRVDNAYGGVCGFSCCAESAWGIVSMKLGTWTELCRTDELKVRLAKWN